MEIHGIQGFSHGLAVKGSTNLSFPSMFLESRVSPKPLAKRKFVTPATTAFIITYPGNKSRYRLLIFTG